MRDDKYKEGGRDINAAKPEPDQLLQRTVRCLCESGDHRAAYQSHGQEKDSDRPEMFTLDT